MKKFKIPKFKTAKVNVKAVGAAPTDANAKASQKESRKRMAAFVKRVKK